VSLLTKLNEQIQLALARLTEQALCLIPTALTTAEELS
jgi:hypothetical protein